MGCPRSERFFKGLPPGDFLDRRREIHVFQQGIFNFDSDIHDQSSMQCWTIGIECATQRAGYFTG